MADAVGAEQAFFSTCGSPLSVKTAMLAVAGREVLVSQDAHKSVVVGHLRGHQGDRRGLPPAGQAADRRLDRLGQRRVLIALAFLFGAALVTITQLTGPGTTMLAAVAGLTRPCSRLRCARCG